MGDSLRSQVGLAEELLATHSPRTVHRRKLARVVTVSGTPHRVLPSMQLRHRRYRWLALVAIFGLLFQQLAMAAYVCPLERDATAGMDAAANPPCHQAGTTDKARCHQHCHPQTTSPDHSPPLTVPPAILPPTTWQRAMARQDQGDRVAFHREITAWATAPPITVRHCTFQI